jgi:hypothetical protein
MTESAPDEAAPTVSRAGKETAQSRWHMPPLLRDVLLIVLGSIIAFGFEELRDTRKRQERVVVALASIRAEIAANIDLVEHARTHHLHVIDTLQFYRARHELPPLALVYSGVFNPASVSGVAWQAARESGVLSDMKYSTILLLAPVYEKQERYRALTDAVTIALENDVRRDGMEAVMQNRFAQFIDLATDFQNRELNLGDRYRTTLKQLDDAR